METNNLMLQTIYIAISLSYFYLILNVGRCNLSNFLKECYKNIDTSIDDDSTDLQDEDEEDEDDDEEDYDSDDVILVLNLS